MTSIQVEKPPLKVIDYIIAADRNNPDEARAHWYAITEDHDYWPMCIYGWNRSDGDSFSILRGNGSARGVCKVCQIRKEKKLEPIFYPTRHKTKWL